MEKNIGKINIGNTWKKKLPKQIIEALKTKRQLIKKYKTLPINNPNITTKQQQQISQMESTIYDIRARIELQLANHNNKKRTKNIEKCTGN